jgi:hypothetical protein
MEPHLPGRRQRWLALGDGGLHVGEEEQGENRAARPAGVHLPGSVDPLGQITTAHECEREQDLAGQEAIGGSGSGQPRKKGAMGRKEGFLLLPHSIAE